MEISQSEKRRTLFLFTAAILIAASGIDLYKAYEAISHVGIHEINRCNFNILTEIKKFIIANGIIVSITYLSRDLFSKSLVLFTSMLLLAYALIDKSVYWDGQHCDELSIGDGVVPGILMVIIVSICIVSFVANGTINIFKYLAGKYIKRE